MLIHYSDELVKQLYNAAVKRARTMAADLMAGKTSVRHDGFFAMLLRWTYIWCDRPLMKMIALDFKVSKACTKCLKCVNNCPKQNISVKKERIKFGAHCSGCYRCVYSCPQKAISGRLFNFVILKNGYDIQRIIEDDTIDGNFITKDTKGIFKTLYGYLNE